MPERDDTYYSPRRIEAILRQLPYLPEPGVYASDIRPMQVARGKGSDRLERQMCERADVEWALAQLPTSDRTHQCVYLCHVRGLTLMEVADVVGFSHETVRRRRTAGIKEMVRLLQGEVDQDRNERIF